MTNNGHLLLGPTVAGAIALVAICFLTYWLIRIGCEISDRFNGKVRRWYCAKCGVVRSAANPYDAVVHEDTGRYRCDPAKVKAYRRDGATQ